MDEIGKTNRSWLSYCGRLLFLVKGGAPGEPVEVSMSRAHNRRMTPAIDKIVIRDFPQLALIAWNRRPDDEITGEDAFALYEANWRFIEEDRLQPRERDMIARLTEVYGHGLMNV